MGVENLTGKIIKGMDKFVDGVQWNGKAILRSNEPINKVGKFVMGEADTGVRGTLTSMSKGKGFGEAVKGAYHNADGDFKWGTAAGTYVGAALAGRVITGGGMYRDSTGNVNIPGVPFV